MRACGCRVDAEKEGEREGAIHSHISHAVELCPPPPCIGGLLSGPLMLKLGVEPSVAAATSSFMIVFTASSSVLQYSLLGRLSGQYVFFYGLVGFAGGMMGQKIISHLVQKHRKQSILVFLLAFITLFSAVAIVVIEALSGNLGNTAFNTSQVCS